MHKVINCWALKLIVLSCVIADVIAQNKQHVYLFGDSLTLNMINYDSVFDTNYYNVNNYAISACSIALLTDIINPQRDTTKLYNVMQQNMYLRSRKIEDIIVPDMSVTKPTIVSVMIGLADIISSYPPNLVQNINNYKTLLDLLEKLLDPSTIVFINSIPPMIDTRTSDFINNIVYENFKQFNEKLSYEINFRNSVNVNKIKYQFVDLFTYFQLNGGQNINLYLNENDTYMHINQQGYDVWRNMVSNILTKYYNNDTINLSNSISKSPSNSASHSMSHSASPSVSNSMSHSASSSPSKSPSVSFSISSSASLSTSISLSSSLSSSISSSLSSNSVKLNVCNMINYLTFFLVIILSVY